MNTHQTTLRFCIEDDAPIATLEAVLAIVRRLDLQLLNLRSHAQPKGQEVQLRIAATEEDALVLCRMRLNNVVGVMAVRVMPVTPARPVVDSSCTYAKIPPYNSDYLHKQDSV